MQPNRVEPALASGMYDTYAVRMPKATHQRRATCEEVECAAHLNGWVTRVPMDSEAAQYIESGQSGRRFQETTGMQDFARVEREFMFLPGQQCFAEHWVTLERDPLFLKKHGDWRSGGALRTLPAEQWMDEFAENQQNLSKILEEG